MALGVEAHRLSQDLVNWINGISCDQGSLTKQIVQEEIIIIDDHVLNLSSFQSVSLCSESKMSSKNVIFAELSVNPIGSGTTSMGKEIDEALKAIKKIEGLKYEVNPMGTLLESEKLETILEAARVAHEAVLRLGDMRVETILKIDDRRDKLRTMAALK